MTDLPTKSHIRACFALSLIALTMLGAIGCGARTASSVTPPEYVALGDSFTAGVGIKPQATRFVPDGCRQSLLNYPHLVARELAFLVFADASCGAARIADLNGSQPTNDGTNAPQFDRLSDETLYVSLSIGGNDAGYGDVVDSCLRNTDPNATPCADKFVSSAGNQLVANAAALEPELARAIDRIRMRSPRAKIAVVGYPRMLPPGGRGCGRNVGVSRADATVINGWLVAINSALRSAAANQGATFVDLYEQSEGHDACKPRGERWIEPGSGTDGADSFHPNEAGQEAAARAVAGALEALSGPSGELGSSPATGATR
ncbi:MAG: SGNH/GDSL hydrolase family protein [Solirubrobacterales bacterium]